MGFCIDALRAERQVPAAHHRLLITELEAVARGETRKLMVLMPPGSAKTTYGSYLFPPWLMARGSTKILAASHTIKRAEYVSKQVRRFAIDNARTLGFALQTEAVEQWDTSNGSEYLAAGVGMGIAGFRADLGLIDDPVKTRQDADSETMQEAVWSWYWSDFYPRLRPGAAQILIMTRWSEGDLGGRLEEAEGDQWRMVRLPAIAEINDLLGREPGEFLWSDDAYGFGEKLRSDYVSFTKAGRTRDWEALYQQRPAPETGDYFRREWLRTIEEPPPRSSLRVYGASDYAVTSNGGDFTVHIVVGMDSDDRLWLLDLWRGQRASDTWIEAFCDLVIQWKPIGWAEETGQIRAGLGPFLDRRQRERQAFVARTAFPTKGDKAVRAQSIRGRMALQGLHIPASAPWRADFESELMSFPAGKHDDQCLAEGTLISMSDGSRKPIECVVVSDWVATPLGSCEVIATRVTNEAARVLRISLNNGTVLTATANHPIMVVGKGFVRVDALCIMDQLELEQLCAEELQQPKSSNIMAGVTDATPIAATKPIAGIFLALNRVGDFFTATFGKMSAVRFLLGITSIIAMVTPRTTTSPTWSVSPLSSTEPTIRYRLRAKLNTLQSNASLPLSGTLATLGVSGTEHKALSLGSDVDQFARFAFRVMRRSMRKSSAQSFVHRPVSSEALGAVRPFMAGTLQMGRMSPVNAVGGCSQQNGLSAPLIALKPAGCVIAVEELSVPAKVLNLTVNRAHTFYANGVLTHNCDALGLIGQLLDVMTSPSKPKKPAIPRDGYWTRKEPAATNWRTA